MSNNNREVIKQYIERIWNNCDIAALEEFTSGEFSYQLGGQPPRDINAMKEFIVSVHEAFPDWRVDIKDISAEEDLIAVRWEGKVTHKGPFHGIAPTGRQINVCGINIYKLQNEKILQEWEQMDSLGMLGQLGAFNR